MEVVAADIGGTNARFAIATVGGGSVLGLSEPVTLKCADFASFQTAWESFGRGLGRTLPASASVALAAPIQGDVIKMTNNPWVIRPSALADELKVDRLVLINDFGAVAHAVQHLPAEHLRHLCGPADPLPGQGVISILGPGTGLGVATILRGGDHYHVVETEGGHMDFSPLDSIEDALLARLRKRFTRVSVERVVSGPGLAEIYETLAALEGRAVAAEDDKELWTRALAGQDSLASAAFGRFCLSLGAAAGDYALAQGAKGVVIAGGLGHRIGDRLPGSGFEDRFLAKGRFRHLMSSLPVKLMTYPEPGLFGAAAAFARDHATGAP